MGGRPEGALKEREGGGEAAPPAGEAVPSPDDYLAWYDLTVDSRPAVYGVGGRAGPPVVFLHGWAMGSRAYKRAIRRLASRGCRVYAPSLPSFGGSADLPGDQLSVDGYAKWVASFMEEVGIDEPALVIGHSFGGGVGIKLADLFPERVKYLFLLNTVGATHPRPPWEWVLGLVRELWPVPQGLEMLQAMQSDLLPNVLRNPVSLLKVGRLAQFADLRTEVASLKARGVPVLMLTSEGDSVIPRDAFATLCQLVGTDGHVVGGRHSWLLANPDSFDQVLASTIDLEVAAHHSSRAELRTAEIERLLRHGSLPWRTIRPLLTAAPPLWLMSQPAAAVASDLALCHPRLAKGEVRALARPIEDSDLVRLTIVTADRPGLLADSAALLTADGLSISDAWAVTWRKPSLALHTFLIEDGAQVGAARWDRLGKRLQAVSPTASEREGHDSFHIIRVTVHDSADQSVVKVTARNDLGLLSAVCRWFHEQGINIESLHARTTGDIARDTLLVRRAGASSTGVVGDGGDDGDLEGAISRGVDGQALSRYLRKPVGLRRVYPAGA